MKPPEHVNATQEQLDELLTLAKPVFPAAQYELLQGVLATFVYVMLALQNAKTSLARFRKMLFGGKTESKRNVLGQGAATGDKPAEVDEANAEAGAAPVVEESEGKKEGAGKKKVTAAMAPRSTPTLRSLKWRWPV